MTVGDLVSSGRNDGFSGKVTIWKSDSKNINGYEIISIFDAELYKMVPREILDLKVEDYDFEFGEKRSPEPSLTIFVNQENSTKKIQELFNR